MHLMQLPRCCMNFTVVVLLSFMMVNSYVQSQKHPSFFNIGGIFSNNDNENYFSSAIAHLNFDAQYVPKGVAYYDRAIQIDINPNKTALDVCNSLIKQRVYAIVVSDESTADLSPAAISYTKGFHQIPTIAVSSRDAAFSDKNIHASFLRTVPPFHHQADVWLEILKHFGYTKVIVIHSSDTDGRAILGRFQTTSQTNYDDIDVRATVESIIEFEPKLENFTENLIEMKAAQSRVYLLYANTEDSYVIFRDAAQNNMTETDHIWIVTEQALHANNTPIGVLGLELKHSKNKNKYIKDALYVLVSAIKEMIYYNETITDPPKDCNDTGAIWESERKLYNYLLNQNIKGETGQVAFDSNGDRKYAEYDVVNVKQSPHSTLTYNDKVGSYSYDNKKRKMKLTINNTELVWPGNTENK